MGSKQTVHCNISGEELLFIGILTLSESSHTSIKQML